MSSTCRHRDTGLTVSFCDLGMSPLANSYLAADQPDWMERFSCFLIDARDPGKTVVGYGAPAKGHTLLNYCGVRMDLIDYTVDRSPHKQDRQLPGGHVSIYRPARIGETKPDYVLILLWNLKDEIMQNCRMFVIGLVNSWSRQRR